VSDITGAPVQEIEGLNPSLMRMSTPPDDEYDLRLPAGMAAVFEKDIAEIPVEKRRYWRFHQVQEGDTLASLARTWHVSESELAYVNQLKPDADLDRVDSVIIPQAPTSEGVLRATFYKARKGDSLVTIADRFGVTVEQLRRWNRIYRGTAVTAGRRCMCRSRRVSRDCITEGSGGGRREARRVRRRRRSITRRKSGRKCA